MVFKHKIIFGISRILIFATGMIISTNSWVQAQDDSPAFKEIDVMIALQENTNRNYFHDYWSPSPAFHVEFSTPFYLGSFFISGGYTSFTGTNYQMDLPDFDNLQASVGWGMRFNIIDRIEIGSSFGTLFSMMNFKNVSDEQQERAEKRFGSTSPESEIGFRYGADVSYDFTQNWGVRLQWTRNVVYTETKMKLNYVGLGIYRTFNTPEWLRKVLR